MGFLPGSLRNRRRGSKWASSLAVSVGVTALFAFAHPTNAQTYSYGYPSYYAEYYAAYYAGAGYRSLPRTTPGTSILQSEPVLL